MLVRLSVTAIEFTISLASYEIYIQFFQRTAGIFQAFTRDITAVVSPAAANLATNHLLLPRWLPLLQTPRTLQE